MKELEKNGRELFYFFVIAFGFAWSLWIPKVLIDSGLVLPSWISSFVDGPYNPAPFGPTLAAFYLVYRNEGARGLINFLKRGVDFSFDKKWLAPVLLLMPAITFASLAAFRLTGGSFPELPLINNPLLIVYWFFYMLLLSGPLQEEFGWRGFALDRLQSRYSALSSSLILGFIWSIWHFPLNFTTGVGPQYSLILQLLIGTIVTITATSVLFTWIYNNTGKSILAAILFHTSLNLSTFKLFPVFENDSIRFYLIFVVAAAVIITAIWGKQTLTETLAAD